MTEHRTCSRGWAARCAASKGRTCRCACGGRNHGGLRQARRNDDEALPLTDPNVFAPEWDETAGDYRTYREFLPGAVSGVGDIRLWREQVGFCIDGSPQLEACASIPQRYVYHSPTGFEWGYGGSGPADLALNILALFVPPPEAWRLHHDFKRVRLAGMAGEGGTIEASGVIAWITAFWAKEDDRDDLLRNSP